MPKFLRFRVKGFQHSISKFVRGFQSPISNFGIGFSELDFLFFGPKMQKFIPKSCVFSKISLQNNFFFYRKYFRFRSSQSL